MRLAHLHIPKPIPYASAARLQDRLVQQFLAHKADPDTKPPSDPIILTAQFNPVYTCGRREASTVSPAQEAHLRAGGRAEFYAALRGGQTTFHGPGQLVAYPILDLRRHGLSARSYVCLLEESVIRTCARFGIRGFRTQNPGVWVTADDKICALGVHLRRFISSHGIGLNVDTDLSWFERIVACGLEGKHATSFEKCGVSDTTVDEVAAAFVDEMKMALKIDKVVNVRDSEID